MSSNNRGGNKPPQTKVPRITELPAAVSGMSAVSDEDKIRGLAQVALTPAAVVDADIAPAELAEEQTEEIQEKLLRSDGRTWRDKNARVICYFQVRMPEPLKEKLAVVTRLTPRTGKKAVSEHSIVLEALERDLDRRLRALGYKP